MPKKLDFHVGDRLDLDLGDTGDSLDFFQELLFRRVSTVKSLNDVRMEIIFS